MAWGGAEEQEQQLVAGDHNAKNWHNEALKVVECAMWDYWKEDKEESRCQPAAHKQSAPASHSSPTNSTTLESTYDHHRSGIMERAAHENSASVGLLNYATIPTWSLRTRQRIWTLLHGGQ